MTFSVAQPDANYGVWLQSMEDNNRWMYLTNASGASGTYTASTTDFYFAHTNNASAFSDPGDPVVVLVVR